MSRGVEAGLDVAGRQAVRPGLQRGRIVRRIALGRGDRPSGVLDAGLGEHWPQRALRWNQNGVHPRPPQAAQAIAPVVGVFVAGDEPVRDAEALRTPATARVQVAPVALVVVSHRTGPKPAARLLPDHDPQRRTEQRGAQGHRPKPRAGQDRAQLDGRDVGVGRPVGGEGADQRQVGDQRRPARFQRPDIVGDRRQIGGRAPVRAVDRDRLGLMRLPADVETRWPAGRRPRSGQDAQLQGEGRGERRRRGLRRGRGLVPGPGARNGRDRHRDGEGQPRRSIKGPMACSADRSPPGGTSNACRAP